MVLTGTAADDLDFFSTQTSVINLRNMVGADVVTGMLRTGSSALGSLLKVCGVSYVQTFPTCSINPVAGCNTGINFINNAFNLVSQSCAISDYSFTHEFGHLVGGNHVRFTAPTQFPPGWIDAVINNGYQYAFGSRVSPTFASIMYADHDITRRLHFSNPDVIVDGIVTGHVISKDNARVIDELSPAMALFRERPDLIFINGFE